MKFTKKSNFANAKIILTSLGFSCNNISKKNICNIIRTNFIEFSNIIDKEKVLLSFCKKNSIVLKKEKSKQTITPRNKDRFYKSPEWQKIRYEVLREQNGKCQLCGRTRKDGVVLHVDHIIPLSKDWSKRLCKDNLQVLCMDCNLGKSNKDKIDWR